MKYLTLPDRCERPLSFYLAMEEYAARRMDDDELFFMWQVGPSVIFGRHQVLENEVNTDYCRQHGIRLFQRKSGGGCVYADHDNLMWSFVTAGEQVGFAFNRFVNMVLLVLRQLGIEAVGTSHNDIMIDGRKVCGTACYHVAGHSIVHSTMLYDTCMEHMLHAITPSREKLQRKGVESVRQRITLLKEYTQLSLEDVKQTIRRTLCEGGYVLSQDEVAAIEQLEETYSDKDFIKILQ